MLKAKFLQPASTTIPKSKMFARRAAARRAESMTSVTPADDKATLPVMVVSPDLFATMVPGVADLNIADAEPTIEAATTPATKTRKRGRTREKSPAIRSARKRKDATQNDM